MHKSFSTIDVIILVTIKLKFVIIPTDMDRTMNENGEDAILYQFL